MKDIENRNDIIAIVNLFYENVKKDDLISHFFSEVVSVQWEKHLPKMYDFWESILFHSQAYQGNPMAVHIHLSSLKTLEPQHFNRWFQLFETTVDELFVGEQASNMKERASNISRIMLQKVSQPLFQFNQ